jgi:hypothetical protein
MQAYMKKIGFLLLGVVLLTGCNLYDKDKKQVDVSGINAPITIMRFDKEVGELDADNLAARQIELRNKYDRFYDTYISRFALSHGVPPDSVELVWDHATLTFVGDYYVKKLQTVINNTYGNTDDVDKSLEDALKHVRFYFPRNQLPERVYTINSLFGMTSAIMVDSSTLVVPLDNYLGANSSYYDSVEGIPQYLRKEMSREYIARDCISAYYATYYGRDYINSELPVIEAMVEAGMHMYFLEMMLPDAPDSLLMGWTQKQTEWCANSEASIWSFYNEKDILYKNNFQDKKRNLDKSPTTIGMPAESPGNVGTWLGWQIVRSFMKNSGGKVTLTDLLTKYSPAQIIATAKYKPKA